MATGEASIHAVFEPSTGSWQYIVADPATSSAAIIDPVLDYDAATGTISTRTADAILELVKVSKYQVVIILETHAHADHISAASYLQNQIAREQGDRPPVAIGKRIVEVQKTFGPKYMIPAEELKGVFDKLLDDDEVFQIGSLNARAIHLPGHTPDHMGYKIGDNVFVGDSIYHADLGSARADFPGGSAQDLFNSGRKLLSMPDHVRIWSGHDYPPETRETPVPWMTVGQHKTCNRHLKDGTTESNYIALREKRDRGLAEPKLLHQALQMNVRGGRLPWASKDGQRMLLLPLRLNGLEW